MAPAQSKPGLPAPSGLLVVDKPAGISSHGVVARARRLLGTKKVGHAGTLDPMATGVLVLGIGRATKLLGYISGDSKTYEATIRLGVGTVTDDAEGDVEKSPGFNLVQPAAGAGGVPSATTAELEAAISALTGQIEQVPSAVSAIKVNGKRAYALVRAGEDVKLKPRAVRVTEFALAGEPRPGIFEPPSAPEIPVVDVDVAVDCSSGTYVRALARDLGRALGTAAHLTALRRTRVGEWGIGGARSLRDLEDLVDRGEPVPLIPVAEAVLEQFEAVVVSDAARGDFLNGRVVPAPPLVPEGQVVALCAQSDPGQPFALARRQGDRFVSVLHLLVNQ